ncbi:uncharacterized protein [Montipora capricornis]|uniref:uncharacterized protein isoform X2 n=1 Tax=Montipora capricornis TaxID=246305 RepID=UPI0035F1FCE0
MLQAKQSGCDRTQLTQQLRRYSAEHVKITKNDIDQTKQLVDKYIKNEVLQYMCSNSALPISKQEYTGSLYERLKTEAADEVDVMVVLQTDKHDITKQDAGVPGFVLLKTTPDSPFQKYTNADGYIIPEKLRASWFFGLVQKAVNNLKEKYSPSPIKLEVHAHGPAVQLDITVNSSGKKLSADLVPSFQLSPTEYFVAKSYTGKKVPPADPKLLWRQSFSVKEKARLLDMDKEDQGCRHELLRIIKTMIRAESSFAKVTSYHLKTIFLQYNSNSGLQWGSDMLGERFLEYMEMLYKALDGKVLNHFWVRCINLLEDIPSETLENMAGRLRRILDNDKERRKVLKCQNEGQLAVCLNREKASENGSIASSASMLKQASLLQLLRRFLDDLGPLLSEETKWCKEVIDKYLINGVLKYCQDQTSGAVISKFDYGGSLYESLKILGCDSDDVLIYVVLKSRKGLISFDVDKAGYAIVKETEGSPLYKDYSNCNGFLLPKKFTSWLLKIASSAVQLLNQEVTCASFKASSCSTGVKVAICEQSTCKSVEVQLIPTFQLNGDEFFIPPPQHGYLPGADLDTAWAKSYTFTQKALLKDMDRDKGCRRDLFKVVNMILKQEATFSRLSSFHLKMAFLWYNSEMKDFNKDKLDERFTGFLECLRNKLQVKVLEHFWIKDLNLLSEISVSTLENMHTRLTRLLNSEQERNKVLRLKQKE